jgi:hypothetical protein
VIGGLNLSGRMSALLAGAVVLVVLLAGWFLLVSPQRSKAANLSVKIDSTQAQVASTQAYVDSPQTKRAVHDLKRLQLVLPDDPKMSQILRQLSAASGTAGVSLDNITPGVLTPSSGGSAVPIALTVTGHYFNISRFLRILRRQVDVKGTTIRGSGRLYTVDGITFNGGSGAATTSSGTSQAGESAISAAIALNAFVNGAAAPVASATTDTTSSDTTSTDTTSTDTTTTAGASSP